MILFSTQEFIYLIQYHCINQEKESGTSVIWRQSEDGGSSYLVTTIFL
jgi:hypothetical protein